LPVRRRRFVGKAGSQEEEGTGDAPHRAEPRRPFERALREGRRLVGDADVADDRAMEREPHTGGRTRFDGPHAVEGAPADGEGVGVAPGRLGDAGADAVEVPRADRPPDALDGQAEDGQRVGGGRELAPLDQRIDAPQLTPHGGAGAAGAGRDRQHLRRHRHPLGAAGRTGARLLPCVQGVDEGPVVL
jgi:hypothetical protein